METFYEHWWLKDVLEINQTCTKTNWIAIYGSTNFAFALNYIQNRLFETTKSNFSFLAPKLLKYTVFFPKFFWLFIAILNEVILDRLLKYDCEFRQKWTLSKEEMWFECKCALETKQFPHLQLRLHISILMDYFYHKITIPMCCQY